MNSGKYDNAVVFCETIVFSKFFINAIQDLFKPEINEKAGKFVDSGKYASFIKSQQSMEKLDMSEINEKSDKKEDRRNKAAQGKAGGGAQGRETKTKSAKNKKTGGKSKKNVDIDNDAPSKKSTLEFMNSEELGEKLSSVNGMSDATEELIEELCSYFQPNLNKAYEESLSSLYQSKVTASMQSKRRNFQEFQDKVNTLVENLRLFEKGISCFDDDKDKFEKYLLKTLGQELINELILYACQENEVSYDENKVDLNVDQRLKLIAQLPKDVGQPLANLNKNLDHVQDLLTCLEDHLSSAVGVTLKKTDRKKDRQIVFNHR